MMSLSTPSPNPGFLMLLGSGAAGDALSPDQRSAVEQLCDLLETHEDEERELLREYQEAATSGIDAGVDFLMQIILEDEQRHHRLMKKMADDVRQSLIWTHGTQPLPPITATAEARQVLLRRTKAFLDIEHESLHQLNELQLKVKQLKSGLLELLVQGMRTDTEKHAHILEYIKKQLEQPA